MGARAGRMGVHVFVVPRVGRLRVSPEGKYLGQDKRGHVRPCDWSQYCLGLLRARTLLGCLKQFSAHYSPNRVDYPYVCWDD